MKQSAIDFSGDSQQQDTPCEAPRSHGETQSAISPSPTSPEPTVAQREADRQSNFEASLIHLFSWGRA